MKLSYLSKFRLVKIETEDGAWQTLTRTYKTAEDLQEYLKQHKNLKGVYSSCSLWYNPTALELSFNKKDAVFIRSDIIIDIDDEDVQDSDEESLQVKKHLDTKPELEFIKRLRSGGGFHLVYKVIDYPTITNPDERLRWFKLHKEKICDELVNKGFGIDYPVCVDIYRVSRMEGSPHPSGETCREVSPTHTSRMMLETANEKTHGQSEKEPRSKTQVGKAIPSKPTYYFIRQVVTNNVTNSKDCFIPYFSL